MTNIFDSLKSYAGSWRVVNSRKFNEDEINAISSNEVTTGQYGLSVCFFMKDGKQKFIPLSNRSKKVVGDSLDLAQTTLLTLERDGEQCLRVED